ncbi:MAG: hypothetical protein NTU44_01190 [Bacteroidetes bacterium]|nr:hypothetical protein [Bacteroidota bacterium]
MNKNVTRLLIIMILVVVTTGNAFAQIPHSFNYQSVVRDGSGMIVANQNVKFRISLLQGSITGSSVYTEIHTATSNAFGLVNLGIGDGMVESGDFSLINWADGPYFIKVEMDATGGNEFLLMGTSQLKSVPYALYAERSGDTSNAMPSGTSPGEMLYWNGNAWVLLPPGSYGQSLFFCNGVPTWGACPVLLTTNPVSAITATSAISGGNISNDGANPVTARGVCWNTHGNPTIADPHTVNGTGIGMFISNLTGLLVDTTYFIRAYATNSAGTNYGNELSFTAAEPYVPVACGDTLTDSRDGTKYTTVQIGTQCWMKQNLNIGSMINGTSDQTDNGTIEKYCYSNSESYCSIYGGLYQWNEMMQYSTIQGTKGICPTGWHLPTEAEWCMLTSFLDSTVNCNTIGESGTDAGGKMKSLTIWNPTNVGATNSSGFTGLPGGYRYSGGGFSAYNFGYFWSSTEASATTSWDRSLFQFSAQITRAADNKDLFGFSVRCLQDSIQVPIEPANPSPPSGALEQPLNSPLSWTFPNFGGGPYTYNVFFGNSEPLPLVSGNQGNITYTPTELDYHTQYYWKVQVITNSGYVYEGPVWYFVTEEPPVTPACGSPFVDSRDGQTYNTVQIGTQCWMKQNLSIGLQVQSGISWDGTFFSDCSNNNIIEKYCYDNLSPNCEIYVVLYYWNEMMQYSTTPGLQGICPAGWHLPADTEWNQLSNFLGGDLISGGKLKQEGTTHWNTPNTGATNTSQFTAFAAGQRLPQGGFTVMGNQTGFWSSTQGTGSVALVKLLGYDAEGLFPATGQKTMGYSVRCVRNTNN